MAITISGANNVDKILATDGVLDSISGFNVVGVMTAGTFDVTGKTTTGHLNIGSNIQIGNAGIITATTLIGNVTGNINATSNLLLQIGGSEKFRVASSGQLGIGGANYGSSGQVLTSGGSGSAATWSTINSDKITEGNTEAEVVDTGSDGHFKVTTEGSERLRINSSGNARLGGTSNTTDQGYRFTLQGSANATYLQFFDNGTGTTHGSDGSFVGLINQDFYVWNREAKDVIFGSSNNERLRILSNGKVGVNTTGPSQQFTSYAASGYPVLANGPSNGIGLGGNGVIVFGNKDLASYGSGAIDASDFAIKTSGSERLRIESGGDIRFNNADSIIHTSADTSRLRLFGGSTNSVSNGAALTLHGVSHSAGNYADLAAGTSGHIQFRVGTSEKLRITSDGKVGINQAPTRELSLHSPNNNNALIHFTNDDTGETASDGILVGLDGNENMVINNQESGKNIIVYTHNGSSVGERLRLGSTGNLALGGTNTSGYNGHANFFIGGISNLYADNSVNSGSSVSLSNNAYIHSSGGWRYRIGGKATNIYQYNGDLGIRNAATGSTDGTISWRTRFIISNDGTSGHLADNYNLGFYSSQGASGSYWYQRGSHGTTAYGGGTDVYFVRTNGNVQNANNSYGQSSDIKLKENVIDAGSQWNDIKNLKVRKFNYKAETGLETHTQIGLIAQETELISAGLVEDINDTSTDSEGKITETGTVTKHIKYSVLYMKSVKALQEAQARIETLEAKVAALESS